MKGEFSLRSVRTLFNLDLRSRFGTVRKRGIKYRLHQVANAFFFLLVYAVLVLGMYYITRIFVSRSGLKLEYLTIVAVATMAIATIVSTSTVIKNLYQNGDNEMLLRFPVSGKEILVSKSIYCFLHNLLVCAFIMLPIYISFGIVTGAPAVDYATYLGMMVFSSILPYCIANIIAVPVMKVMNRVKNKFIIVLIFTIIVLCAVFIVYLVSLSNVLSYMRDSQQNFFSASMIDRYRAFASNAYPFNWYAELISGRRLGNLDGHGLLMRFVYLLAINVGLGIIAAIVTSREYYKMILYGIETQKASFRRKIRDKKHSRFYALFRREFFLILRSFNYSFQYLAMACAAPVMVFFCNRLAATMGKNSVGGAIMPGLTLMVIIIFITITVSFASTCISREGNCFYHTKVIPVSYPMQLFVKFCLYAVVASVSVGLCCLVSGLYYTSEAGGKVLTALDVGAIFGICETIVISLTCLCIICDVNSPTFNVSGDGELVAANKNVTLAMIIGIVVAIVFGVFAMLFNFMPLTLNGKLIYTPGDMKNVYLTLAVVSGVLLIGSVAGLWINLNKKYQRIVP